MLGALLVSAAAAAAAAAVAAAAAPPATLELHAAACSSDAGAIARLLSSTAPGGASLPDAPVGSTPSPIIAALEGRHEAFDRNWPRFSAEPHRAALAALPDSGANAAIGLPTLEAVTYRNVKALKLLLSRMSSSAARECLGAGAANAAGQSLFHVAAERPAAGLARVVSRAARLRPRAARPPDVALRTRPSRRTALRDAPRASRARPCPPHLPCI
jgi:hypothetical protein